MTVANKQKVKRKRAGDHSFDLFWEHLYKMPQLLIDSSIAKSISQLQFSLLFCLLLFVPLAVDI